MISKSKCDDFDDFGGSIEGPPGPWLFPSFNDAQVNVSIGMLLLSAWLWIGLGDNRGNPASVLALFAGLIVLASSMLLLYSD